MDLAAVMAEMGTKLNAIDGLRVTPYTAEDINPPAALVELPDAIIYDESYGRGSDSIEINVTVAVARIDARNAHLQLAKYANGSGPYSIKQALEAGPNVSYGTLRVKGAVTNVGVKFAGAVYMAAVFTVDVSGDGE